MAVTDPIVEKPCRECPYRKKSFAGWLGAATPEQFMRSTMSDQRMPCHLTIDYDDPDWKEKWSQKKAGKLCAGAAVFFSNQCKLSRDPDRPRLEADRENVFSYAHEFIKHHRQHGRGSWSEGGEDDRDRD